MNNYVCHYKNTLGSTLLRAEHLFVRFGVAILMLWVLTFCCCSTRSNKDSYLYHAETHPARPLAQPNHIGHRIRD